MHLLLDCRSIHRAMGGIGQAATHLVRHLAANPRGHRLTILVGSGFPESLDLGAVELIQADAAMIDEPFEQLGLPTLLEDLKPDIYLNTAFSVPALKTCGRQVAIVHDVVFEDRPEWVEPGLRSYLQKWSRFAARHADHVITVSAHARQRISEVYGIPKERITAIHNGIAEADHVPPSAADIARVRTRCGLDRPYILYLGTAETKKGTPELIAAFANLVKGSFDGLLVLAGGRSGPTYDLDGDIARFGIAARVRQLGYVDEADKKPLIAGSRLLAYPSLYEGFGLPPLEALALGVPCVASRATSIPEVVGTHALLVDPVDIAAFSAALAHGLEDGAFRARARDQGPAWARRFSWRTAASAYLDVCEALVPA